MHICTCAYMYFMGLDMVESTNIRIWVSTLEKLYKIKMILMKRGFRNVKITELVDKAVDLLLREIEDGEK